MREAKQGSVRQGPRADRGVAEAFVELLGRAAWTQRLAELHREAAAGPRIGRALLRRHQIECTIQRLRRLGAAQTANDRRIAAMLHEAAALAATLDDAGMARLRSRLDGALAGKATLVPLFHMLNSALRQRARGFEVTYAGLQDGAPYDLLLTRQGEQAELACEVVSAEAGRDVHRGAWFKLVDGIDPELQTWLAAHPGRYLLKITLPNGLREGEGPAQLADLHARISNLLSTSRRSDHDEAAVLRLDPLLLAGAQADELGLVSRLRGAFGPEAHLAVTSAGEGVFVMAARAGRENEVAVAVRRRMAEIAPQRLTGARPGILAMFVDDTDPTEWRGLRERLELEGEARQFLTHPHARRVVAVTCTSRIELFEAPEAVNDGELRFRNPAHPAAKGPGLAPAVLSTV